MSITPVEFATFGGLDLRVDAQQAGPGGAVDMLNVDFDRRGIVRTRDGTTSLYTAAASIDGIASVSGSQGYIFFGTGSNVYLIDSTSNPPGALIATTASAAYPLGRMVSFGGSPWYFVDGSASAVRRVDAGAVVTTPGGIPTGTCIARQSPDQRLVVGNAGGTTGKVAFSDPGDATTFGANNYVTLPEIVRSLVLWNDLLFAFCPNSFYVFYGNSTDSAGEPIFNYRLVSNSVGVQDPSGFGNEVADCTDDGVYFISARGVYKTTGGSPTKVSGALDPLFDERATAPYFVGNSSSPPTSGRAALVCSDGMVYAAAGSPGNNGYWFVLDPESGIWRYWQIADGWYVLPAVQVFDSSLPWQHRTVLASFNGTAISYLNPSATSDNGTAIVSRYRSGFWNPGQPGAEAVVREWLLDGTGTVNFQTAVNDAVTLGSAASVALGTSPAVAQGRDRRAVKGRNVSFQVGASSGAWSLSRVVANVAGSKGAGEKSS